MAISQQNMIINKNLNFFTKRETFKIVFFLCFVSKPLKRCSKIDPLQRNCATQQKFVTLRVYGIVHYHIEIVKEKYKANSLTKSFQLKM